VQITSTTIAPGGAMPDELAFCKADPDSHLALSDNRSPDLQFDGIPDGALSLVLTCVDPDAPTVADDVNQEGRAVAHDLPRGDFVHWVMVDMPADCPGLSAGACSDGVTPRGKTDPPGPAGARQGVNDYTAWFAGDDDMAGTYLGYDGPAPPWNDERRHHYHFRLYALSVARLEVRGAFTVADVTAAMDGHVLATAELVGTYTTNPALTD